MLVGSEGTLVRGGYNSNILLKVRYEEAKGFGFRLNGNRLRALD